MSANRLRKGKEKEKMNFKRKSARYVSIATFAILVTMVLVFASVIPAAKAPAPGLTYYANDGSNFIRSATPFNFQTTDYTFSQTVLPNGGILTTLTPRTTGIPYADFGLGYTFGKLGDIASIPITGSGLYSVNIYFDMNTADDIGGNGLFFGWSGNTFTGLGGDAYGLGTVQITNSGTINTGSSFNLMAPLSGTYTIAQLQAGAVAGIDSNTIVGFWFGVINHPTTAQFEIDGINGLPPAAVPVGGEWSPITFQVLNPVNMLQLIGPWIALALIAAATAVATYRRLLKKHL
jgi:hypothetical protein